MSATDILQFLNPWIACRDHFDHPSAFQVEDSGVVHVGKTAYADDSRFYGPRNRNSVPVVHTKI
jgi:hypothetical protein